ncbi:condensation domain-containing protein [Streptomyces sp. x-19]|uniref:condensation domain-containing protein n=1 Tax=Streptomyces sp. x-19 TaxID=2789280 RepID=UPI00397FACAE
MRRRLSPYERAVWAAGEVLPVNFTAIARVEGHVDPDDIRASLTSTRRRHPLLGVRVADAGRWRAWLTTEAVPDPQLRVVNTTAPDAWARVVEEELPRRFDTATGPLARFVLVDAGDTFDLIAVCHHLVCDGISASIVIDDILRGSAHEVPRPRPVPAVDDLVPRPRPELSDLRKLARALGGSTRPVRHTGPLACTTWLLSAEETTAILTRCRAEGATLQAALCAAFARAFPHPADISVPVDLRRILAPAAQNAVGLYATSIVRPVDGTAPVGFWTLARHVRADLQHHVGPDELSPLVRAFRVLRFLPHKTMGSLIRGSEAHGARFDVSISNANLPNRPDYGPLRLSAIYGAAHTSLSGAPLVIVVGYDGQLFLSVTSGDETGSKQLCERAMSQLADALASPPVPAQNHT